MQGANQLVERRIFGNGRGGTNGACDVIATRAGLGGVDDDGDLTSVASQVVTDLLPGESRHVDVQNENARFVPADELGNLSKHVGEDDFEAVLFETAAKGYAYGFGVVYNENYVHLVDPARCSEAR